MAAGDSITAVDSVSAGTTTIQPSSGDVWRVFNYDKATNTALQPYDGTNAGGNLDDQASIQAELNYIADNSEYLQWNNPGCSAEVVSYWGQKVVE